MKKRGDNKKVIHKELKEKHPKVFHKARRLFHFKYPKLIILVFCIILAYIIFSNERVIEVLPIIKGGYITTFIGGLLIAFGFSAPFGVGLLINANPSSILIGALIAGIGATISDLLIFRFIKFSFMNEFKELGKTKTIQKIEKIIKKNKSVMIKNYLLYVFAGILIATPLPDEIGVSMLAGLTTIKTKKLAIISFILHTLAIFLILGGAAVL